VANKPAYCFQIELCREFLPHKVRSDETVPPPAVPASAALFVASKSAEFIGRLDGHIDVYKNVSEPKRYYEPALFMQGHAGAVLCLHWLDKFGLLLSGSADSTVKSLHHACIIL